VCLHLVGAHLQQVLGDLLVAADHGLVQRSVVLRLFAARIDIGTAADQLLYALCNMKKTSEIFREEWQQIN